MNVLHRIQSTKNILKSLLNSNRRIHSQTVLKSKTHDLQLDICGENFRFPYVWLRDNCQCEACFHRSAQSRTIDWSEFNVDITPRNVNKEGNIVTVIWEDGHKSQYKLDWLKFRNFTSENQKKYTDTIYKPKKITWTGETFNEICTKHDYTQVLSSEAALYNWLHSLSTYGVALIQNTPHSETASEKIVEKIGFSKQTHYGVKFTVQSIPNTSNVAYLSSKLQMHIDLPYYEYCPGTNLLHCLVQTKSQGGENLLSDCHYVANFMKENYPEEYKLLTDTEVEWSDIGTEFGNEFFKLYRAPVICLDKHGEIIRINFSIPQRGSYFPGSIETVKPWYTAHRLFLQLNQKFSAQFKTNAGDILTFDNIRLLHGRNAYEDNSNNVRQLIGNYIDWDEIYSRLRCLKVKLFKEDGMF